MDPRTDLLEARRVILAKFEAMRVERAKLARELVDVNEALAALTGAVPKLAAGRPLSDEVYRFKLACDGLNHGERLNARNYKITAQQIARTLHALEEENEDHMLDYNPKTKIVHKI